MLLSFSTETVAAFEYEDFEVSNAAAFGRGSFLDAVRETTRVFAWGYSSPLGLFSYAAFYVQMATGILLGFLVGRRHWVERLPALREPIRRAQLAALAAGARLPARSRWPSPSSAPSPTARGFFVSAGAHRRPGGADGVLRPHPAAAARAPGGGALAPPLRPRRAGCRSPTTCCRPLLASFVFYGWGLGFWGRASPWIEVALAAGLFFLVQLPLSAWWLSRFRYGPVEYLWRRLTYGRSQAEPQAGASANSSAISA